MNPAELVVCRECAPTQDWPQPFPTSDAAARWRTAHTDRTGHVEYESSTPGEEPGEEA